jgi:hypothetical protein
VLAGTLVAGCGGGLLGGSVSELFPLDVSQMVLLRSPEAFQVSYYRNNGPNVDLVARVTVATSAVNLSPGNEVPLHGEYAPGHPRGTISHQAAGEPLRLLPVIRDGHLRLNVGGNAEEHTEGDFAAAFEVEGDYGAGRNLFGKFSGITRDAGFDPITDGGTDAGP